MGVSAVVKDGEIVQTASQVSAQKQATTKSEKSAPDGYDKDAFLQLLVAQMKYQDPLEPTSNTEYISQYATFSQVEQLQNMASSMDLGRASSMVGQTVQITTTDDKGQEKIVEGVVDYVKYENNKAYVSVNGELYGADSVTAIIEPEYNTAFNLANALADEINKLPSLSALTVADAAKVNSLIEAYNSLSPYQQSFMDSSYADALNSYSARMKELLLQAEAEAKADEATEEAATEEAQEGTIASEEEIEENENSEDNEETVEGVTEA